MSRQVDDRVVSMRFDNAHFENNVKTSLSTLDKLKQSLKLTEASKGLENVNSSARKVDMSPIGNAVDAVRVKFSALQVMGVTALANITNSAINAGKRMVSALTIDPIKTGFQEYETKINSVQTILSNTASKGTKMSDVTRVLDELNRYADMTIYNFAEMTRNIGTFTAAGVGLEDSAAAIQGIANLAAASGSTSQQASTAMYQLSQALAAGTVKLMDWNSVVNAGMGGEKFQEALKATAREQGIAVDAMIKKNGSFRESLQEGWISADILNDTLKKFTVEGAKEYAQSMLDSGKYTKEQADALIKEAEAMNDAATKVKTFTQLWDTLKEAAQSGWAQTWELIIGDFEEAKEFLSGLSDLFGGIIDSSAKARNNLLGGALNSNWDKLSEKIEAAGFSTDVFNDKLTETAKKHGISIDKLIKQHGTLAKAFASGDISTSIITETLRSLLGAEKDATVATKELGDVVSRVIKGDFGYGAERIKALADAGYDYATVQNLVNEKLGSSTRHLSELTNAQIKNADSLADLSDKQLKSKGYTDEQIAALKELKEAADGSDTSISKLIEDLDKPSGRELLLDSFQTILNSCIKSIGAVRNAWREIFPPMTSNQLYNIIAGLNSFTKHLAMSDENADKLKRTFKGLFAILDIILTVVGGPIKIAFKALSQLLGMFDLNILDVTAAIGDAIVRFRDWVDSTLDFTKIFEKIMPTLKGAIKGIRDWINVLKESDNIPRDLIQGLINGFKAGLSYLGNAVMAIGRFILDKLKGILGVHSPSTETYAIAMDTMQGFTNGFNDGASRVWEFFKGFGEKCLEFFKNIDIGQVLAVGLGVTTLLAGKKILNIMEMFASPLEGLGDMLGGLGKMFTGIGKSFKANALKKNAQAVLIFATAIAVLVGALWLLTKIDGDRLWECVGVLAALAAIVAGLAFVMSKIGGISGSAKQAFSLLVVCASLFILINAIKKISEIETSDIIKGVATIAALTVLIVGLMAASKLAGRFGKGTGAMLLKVSIALLIMVGVMKLIAGMEAEDIAKGLLVIAMFEVLIVGLISVSKMAGEYSAKAGSMLLKMSIALLIMVAVIKIISGMSAEEIAKGLITIALIEGLFVAIIAVSKFAGKNATKAGTMLLTMALAIFVLVSVIKLIAGMDGKDIVKGLAVIAVLEVFFGALMVLSSFAGKNAIKAGVMLLTMALALLILTGVLFILSEINPAGLGRALGIITVLEILFGGLIAVSKMAGNATKTLIILVVAIGILVAAVAILSAIEPDRLKVAALALSAIVSAFALLVVASKYAQNVKIAPLLTMVGVVVVLAAILYVLSQLDVGSTLATVTALSILMLTMGAVMIAISKAGPMSVKSVGILALMGLVVAELAAILYALSVLDVQSTMQNAVALSTLLMAMTVAMLILSKTNVSVAAIGTAMIMGLVLAELVGVFYLMQLLDVKGPSLETALALSVLLLALSAACIILSVVGAAAPAALLGALALAGVIAIIGAFLVALGALAQIPGLKWFIEEGAAILKSIGVAIGDFLGGIVGGVMSGISGQFPKIGEDLSKFMTALTPFIAGAKAIDGDTLKGIGALVLAILGLTAANVIQGIASFITGGASFAQLGTDLSAFMTAAMPFIAGANTIDPKAMQGAKVLAEMVLMLTASNLLDATTSFITGGTSFEDLGKQLVSFGTAIVDFSAIVDGNVKESAVTAAANAGKMMAEMAATLPNSGGILGGIMGENDMDDFGRQLVSFGTAIVGFSAIVDGNINESAVTAAASAGKIMAEMANTLPNSGGVLGFFVGNNDMDEFGRQLVLFGQGIADFSKAIDGNINESAIRTAANAGKTLVEMANAIPNSGGVVSLWSGDNTMDSFGSQLKGFGEAICEFSSSVAGVDESQVSKGVAASKKVMELGSAMPSGGVFSSGFNGGTFKTQLVSYAKAIKEFASEIAGIDGGKIAGDISELDKITSKLKTIGDSGVTEFVSSFSNSGPKVSSAISSMIKAASDAISSKKGEFKDNGKTLVNEFSSGIDAQKTKPVTSVKGIVTSVQSEIKSNTLYSSFYSAGVRCVDGFANGISANTYKATAKSRAMAAAARRGAESELDIHSPSKVGYKIGNFFGVGFVNAIDDSAITAYKSSSNMAKYAKDGLNKAVSQISDLLNWDLDVQPTIRPVLDLSEVTTGAKAINGILDTKPSVGILSNVGALNSNRYNRQNGSNSDIVAAIKGLENTLGELSGDRYTIGDVTYDDGSGIQDAVKTLVRAAKVERRV